MVDDVCQMKNGSSTTCTSDSECYLYLFVSLDWLKCVSNSLIFARPVCDEEEGCNLQWTCDDGNNCTVDTCVDKKCVNTLQTCANATLCNPQVCIIIFYNLITYD